MTSARIAIAAGLAASLLGCDADGERRGLIVLPGMVESVPYDPYDPNPVGDFGQTLRLPPEGTIPVGHKTFEYGKEPDEAARAGRELRNPIEPTSESLARGQTVFETFCFVCHGKGGEGDGPIIGRFPNPPSLLADRARGLADGHIYHIITRGQGMMASYAVQIRPDDRWRVVHHLRRLQGGASGIAAAQASTLTSSTSTTASGARQ